MFDRTISIRPRVCRGDIAIALLIPLGGAALVFGLSLYFGG